jgi:alkylation response protein AidB-like acyl-CoA dehydrogenase
MTLSHLDDGPMASGAPRHPVLEQIDELAVAWREGRGERQERTHLDRSDFDGIRSTGFLQTVVPEAQGGYWTGTATSVRSISDMLRVLGAADPSVALVSSMHPAVLAFWLTAPTVDDLSWDRQRRAVYATAMAGQRWGTITSEPGSGGDIMQTRTVARSVGGSGELPGECYELTGVKHFGSGMGITDWMMTTAIAEGEAAPSIFILDVRERPWDGSAGLSLASEWDGIGMSATQSHGMRLESMPAVRFGLDRPLRQLGFLANPMVLTLFTAVIVGILDETLHVARDRLQDRREDLRSYERVEWANTERRHWLACQAFEGAVAAIEQHDAEGQFYSVLRAKQSVAELAEDIVRGVGRVLGGSTFSLSSPFSRWFEDVRALGFLRPPWALAHDQLYESSW